MWMEAQRAARRTYGTEEIYSSTCPWFASNDLGYYTLGRSSTTIFAKFGYTKEAYRFIQALVTNLHMRSVRDLKTAETVTFRGLTLLVLDYAVLIPMEEVITQNFILVNTSRHVTFFHGGRKPFYRVPLDIENPYILNKENNLNYAMFHAAAIAAGIAGRKRREADVEGLAMPTLMTKEELFCAYDLSTQEKIAATLTEHPKPELIYAS